MQLNSRTRYLLSTLYEYRMLIIVPAIAGLVLSVVYVMFIRAESWSTRQRLLVRDDLLGQPMKPGQFDTLEAMKSRQETILDIARSPEVIGSVLKQLGPSRRGFFFNAEKYPDSNTIESYQGKVRLSAPNGGEFGKSETVLINVSESTPERSAKFIELLMNEVEKSAVKVRGSMLSSMVQEIRLSRDQAHQALQDSISQLQKMEQNLGIDTAIMANMSSAMVGENTLRQELVQIENEKRAYEAQLATLRATESSLQLAIDNPSILLSSSNSFLRDQPKLSQVARSIVDAMKEYADMSSRYQDVHPSVENAQERLDVMKGHLAEELDVLAITIRTQTDEIEQQIARMAGEFENRKSRMAKMSDFRGDHIAMNAELTKRAEAFNHWDNSLKNVQSHLQSDGNVVWFSRAGAPQTASAPDGLSKRSSVLLGGLLGFMFGTGLVVLLAPAPPPVGGTQAASGEAHQGAQSRSPVTSSSRASSTGNEQRNRHPGGNRPQPAYGSTSRGESSASQYPLSDPVAKIRAESGRAESQTAASQRGQVSAGHAAAALAASQNIPQTFAGKMALAESDAANRTAEFQQSIKPNYPTVQIPDCDENEAKQLERLEKLLGPKRSQSASNFGGRQYNQLPGQPMPAEFATESNGNSVRGGNSTADPAANLLADLREQRARETDPLASLPAFNRTGSTSPKETTSARTPSMTLQLDAVGLAANVRGAQHSEDFPSGEVEAIKQAIGKMDSNPFLKEAPPEPLNSAGDGRRETPTTARSASPRQSRSTVPLPEQVRQISGSLLGFMESPIGKG